MLVISNHENPKGKWKGKINKNIHGQSRISHERRNVRIGFPSSGILRNVEAQEATETGDER